MKDILVIDTSDNILKAALLINSSRHCICEENTQRHVEILIPKIQQLFNSANADIKALKEIYVCCGPGSFTGLRIGIATAVTMAFSLQIKVYGFCTFSVYEYLIPKRNILIPIVDGKKNQFYCSFITGGFDPYNPDELFDFDYQEILSTIESCDRRITFAGKDASLITDKLNEDGIDYEWLYQNNYTAQQMLDYIESLGEDHKLRYPDPIYIRKSEAEIELLNRQKKI